MLDVQTAAVDPLSEETTKQTEVIQTLTFDPVTLVEVDLSLGLRGVRTNHHKMSPRYSTVQLPPGAYGLAVTAGAGREEENTAGYGLKVKAQWENLICIKNVQKQETL